MPEGPRAWFARIKVVEREYLASRLAIDRLRADVRRDPGLLGPDLTPSDIEATSNDLEGTYIVRLFAEFEACLRLFWPRERRSPPPGRTRDLLDGLASTRKVPHETVAGAHSVREYRNGLVHLRRAEGAPLTIDEARGRLCKFLGHLLPHW